MSMHHLLMDIGLWFITFLWFCQFIADFTREHSRLRRIRRLGPPSRHCDRTGDYEVHMNTFASRRAE